jgi:hypothetical protein
MLKPNRTWDGNPNFKFIVKGLVDANYAADPSSRKSISGYLGVPEGCTDIHEEGTAKECHSLNHRGRIGAWHKTYFL